MKSDSFNNIISTSDFYLEIINNLQDGVYFVDTNRKILFWNKAAEKITGYKASEIVGKNCRNSKLSHIDCSGKFLCELSCPLFESIGDGKVRHDCVLVRHKEGYRIPITVNIFPVKRGGVIVGAIEIFVRNSPRVYDDSVIEKLSNNAMLDHLTSLPNRRYLENFLDFKFDEYRRFGSLFAVLFSDIDNFSDFNNKYGHLLGDEVLKKISKLLKDNTRREDLVGRWGGEEFVGIYSLNSKDAVNQLAYKFKEIISSAKIPYKKSSLSISMSAGVTIIREDDTPSTIIERADSLMYECKKQGKNRVIAG